jgi:hypothetical protein
VVHSVKENIRISSADQKFKQDMILLTLKKEAESVKDEELKRRNTMLHETWQSKPLRVLTSANKDIETNFDQFESGLVEMNDVLTPT